MNFAIVGCGRISSRHAQSIKDIPDANLVVVTDILEHRAQKLAQEFGAEPLPNLESVLERNDVDVVNICTPSGLHADMAVKAMLAGKHVIVEKPMSLTLEDADKMIAASEQTGQKLCVVLQNRYNPPVQMLKTLLDDGKLGDLYLGNATVRWYRPQKYYEDGWHGTLAMDGGALMNQSIHHIDVLQWYMGQVESVFAETATLAHQMEAEDAGIVTLRFANGALGIVEGSTLTYPYNLEGSVAVFGSKGSVKVGGTALNQLEFCKVEGMLEHERELITRERLDIPSIYGLSHKYVIEDMIEAIIQNRLPKTNGYNARNSVAIVLAMYQSARTGHPVRMLADGWYRESLMI